MEEVKAQHQDTEGPSDANQTQNEVSPVITESTVQEIEDQFDFNEEEAQEKVEAVLFIAGRYLTLQELIVLTDINPILLKSILYDLEKKYSTGALRVIRRKESYKMDIAEKHHYLINKLATGSAEFTKAEQETLAIIAYKQPIKQSVVIKIRGNKSYDHIKKFRNLGLVKAKREGHTLILNLSEEFYEYFNVTKSSNQQENKENLDK
jgi:segregation and condensation protein B